jgi:deoxyribose-phosphate aldolase
MDCNQIFQQFGTDVDQNVVEQILIKANQRVDEFLTKEALRDVVSMLDVTSLSVVDTEDKINDLCHKLMVFRGIFSDIPEPAAVCVSPSFVETAGVALGETDIAIASVAGGFPMSQTYVEVKALECAMVEENGADEIDIVMNLGAFLAENYDATVAEIEIIRGEIDSDTTLKVIIETGELPDLSAVRRASLLAMSAGADFVKTSTGKVSVGATPEAVVVMAQAVKDYAKQTGRCCGIKIAGGVRTAEQAALYQAIVAEVLGDEWLTSDTFRIGASSLANNLLSKIEGREINYF